MTDGRNQKGQNPCHFQFPATELIGVKLWQVMGTSVPIIQKVAEDWIGRRLPKGNCRGAPPLRHCYKWQRRLAHHFADSAVLDECYKIQYCTRFYKKKKKIIFKVDNNPITIKFQVACLQFLKLPNGSSLTILLLHQPLMNVPNICEEITYRCNLK